MKHLIYTSLFLVVLYSCGEEGCTDVIASNYDTEATIDDNSCEYDYLLNLNMRLTDNGNTLSTNDSFEFDGNTFRLETMKYYISNLEIETENETEMLLDIHLFDMEKPSTHSLSFNLENKDFGNINFRLGMDSTQNALDQQTVATDHPQGTDNNTFWQMTKIYIFVMVEGKLDEGNNGEERSITYHIADPVLLKNISLSANLNYDSESTKTVNLDLEISEIFNNVDLETVLPHEQNSSDLAIQLMNNLSTAFETN